MAGENIKNRVLKLLQKLWGNCTMADENIKDKGILINEENFPDANFRNWLLEQEYGKTGVITAKEIARITEINVNGMEISSLEGIQYFKALNYLRCDDNHLTALDVSGCESLVTISCRGNKLFGENLDKLIESLPRNQGRLYIEYFDEQKGYGITEHQVHEMIKYKHWWHRT